MMPNAINAELINDRAKLLMHRLIARRLRQQPDLIECARRNLSAYGADTCGGEWAKLLCLDMATLVSRLVARDEVMTRLRLSSPFVGVIDFSPIDLRRRIWRKARLGQTVKGPA